MLERAVIATQPLTPLHDETSSGMSIIWARMVCLLGSRGPRGKFPCAQTRVNLKSGRSVSSPFAMSVKKLLDLSGKIALVTGGSRGLGLQIAEALGEMGAKLAISARKPEELEQAREFLARQRIEALPLVCDISRPDAIEPMVSQLLERHGRVDVLVNNAGATWGAPAEEHPLDAWRKLVDLNLTGTFLVTQAAGKRSMIPNRYGRIINVASIAGLRGNPVDMLETLGYNTTKGGLVNFTRALAAEWGEHGITVNAIAPGFLPSKMTKASLERLGEKIVPRTPLRRLA